MIKLKMHSHKIVVIGIAMLLLLQLKSFGQVYWNIDGCPTIKGFELVDGPAPCIGKSISRRVYFEHEKIAEIRWVFDGVRTVTNPHPNGFTVINNGITYNVATDRPTLTTPGFTNAKVTIVPKSNQVYYGPGGFDLGQTPPILPCPVVNSFMGNRLEVCPAPPAGTCPELVSLRHSLPCINEPIILCVTTKTATTGINSITWAFSNGSTATGTSLNFNHGLTRAGDFSVTVTLDPSFIDCPNSTLTRTISVAACEPDICTDCTRSFVPMPGKTYVVSAWVKEEENPTASTYNSAGLKLEHAALCPEPQMVNFGGTNPQSPIFRASGPIIDGWQKIEQEFRVPIYATDVSLELRNDGGTSGVLFDDIRIFPVDGNMRTFVYDQITHRLMAEGDENNYATFYEYDEEGALIRSKKETELGVKTMQENRQHQVQTIGDNNN